VAAGVRVKMRSCPLYQGCGGKLVSFGASSGFAAAGAVVGVSRCAEVAWLCLCPAGMSSAGRNFPAQVRKIHCSYSTTSQLL
jgi:hypothetical protein